MREALPRRTGSDVTVRGGTRRFGGDSHRNMMRTIGSFQGPASGHLSPMNVDVGGGGMGPMKPVGRPRQTVRRRVYARSGRPKHIYIYILQQRLISRK